MPASSRDFLRKINKRPERFYIIHYSCQNLNDENDGLSPRITSIAVMHYKSGQVVSFSTHAIAEELHFNREEVENHYDDVERELLSQFYSFVRDRRDYSWIHWNMRNATYGFEHLAHRFRILSDENAPSIPPENRINLSDLLKDRYGEDYVPHPRLTELMKLNGGVHRDFLQGDAEVQAFKDGRFIELHKSTLSKVGFFRYVIEKMISGRLRVKTRGYGVMVDRLLESRLAKIIALIASLVGVVLAFVQIFNAVFA